MSDIKQRFALIDKLIFSKDELIWLLKKMPEQYSIYDLTRKWIIAVIKKDNTYLNLSYVWWYTPWVVGDAYCQSAKYMFWWLAVYNLYGFTTQLAQAYTIYNNEFSGEKNICSMDIFLKKVKPDFLYGMMTKRNKGISYQVMSPERAFIEYCRENPEKIYDLRVIYSDLDPKKVANMVNKYPYQTTKDFIQRNIILWKN